MWPHPHRRKTGMIRLTDWDDMQSLCKDETRREQTRQRVTAYRERKRQPNTSMPPRPKVLQKR